MSEIYIYAGNERVGLLQNERSVQWQEFYTAPGEVKIVAGATSENVAYLAEGNRLYNTEFDTAARIEQVELDDTGGKGTLTVRARSSAALLENRVVVGALNISNIELGMYTVLGANRRGLPFSLALPVGYPETLDTLVQWGNVLEAETLLAKAGGFGFKVLFNPASGTEFFTVYKGADRTSGADYVGYFGIELGNLSHLQMSRSSAGCKNVAVVQGGSDGAVAMASPVSVSGEARRELYVDATHLLKEYRVAHDTGNLDFKGNPIYTYTTETYTDAEYRNVLESAGIEALLTQAEKLDIRAEVLQYPIQFGQDYFLGDILPVRAAAYNLNLNARVVSVKKVYEAGAVRTVVGLGDFQ